MQLFLFQQFLMLFLLTPITGAMALAAHAIVGEKQARTLEPLLATPITTFELLAAKVLGALAADAGDLARRPGDLLRRHRALRRAGRRCGDGQRPHARADRPGRRRRRRSCRCRRRSSSRRASTTRARRSSSASSSSSRSPASSSRSSPARSGCRPGRSRSSARPARVLDPADPPQRCAVRPRIDPDALEIEPRRGAGGRDGSCSGARKCGTARAAVPDVHRCNRVQATGRSVGQRECRLPNAPGMGAQRYEDLEIWRLANELKEKTYELIDKTSARTDFKFRDQSRDSLSSATVNIAEGFGYVRPPPVRKTRPGRHRVRDGNAQSPGRRRPAPTLGLRGRGPSQATRDPSHPGGHELPPVPGNERSTAQVGEAKAQALARPARCTLHRCTWHPAPRTLHASRPPAPCTDGAARSS